MKKQLYNIVCCLLAILLFLSCNKRDNREQPVPAGNADLSLIAAAGFSTAHVQGVKDGFLVEGDILLTRAQLQQPTVVKALRVGEVEQYRSVNLVTGLPRVIRVKTASLGPAYVAGVDTAIARYNRLGLRLTFQRISSGTAEIIVQGFLAAPVNGYVTYGSSGFPSGGNPYTTIRLNTHPAAYGSSPNVLNIGSIIQHHIGHCIGMYHTDYMDDRFSCGTRVTDPTGNPVHIPGTPVGPDSSSYMLACHPAGNFTFNANDIIALHYLY